MNSVIKRIATLVILVVFCLQASVISVGAASAGIGVSLNGKQIQLKTAPVNADGIVVVPIKETFEALNADVFYRENENAYVIKRDPVQISLPRNVSKAIVNGKMISLKKAVQTVKGVDMVSYQFIGDSLGIKVSYDAKKKLISISDPSVSAKKSSDPLTEVTPEMLLKLSKAATDKYFGRDFVPEGSTIKSYEIQLNIDKNEMVNRIQFKSRMNFQDTMDYYKKRISDYRDLNSDGDIMSCSGLFNSESLLGGLSVIKQTDGTAIVDAVLSKEPDLAKGLDSNLLLPDKVKSYIDKTNYITRYAFNGKDLYEITYGTKTSKIKMDNFYIARMKGDKNYRYQLNDPWQEHTKKWTFLSCTKGIIKTSSGEKYKKLDVTIYEEGLENYKESTINLKSYITNIVFRFRW